MSTERERLEDRLRKKAKFHENDATNCRNNLMACKEHVKRLQKRLKKYE